MVIIRIDPFLTMHFDENEFDNFSFEDVNIHEVLEEMGKQLIEMWLDLKDSKERILELEIRYGMHNTDIHQMDLL